jgi:hypothetical protein
MATRLLPIEPPFPMRRTPRSGWLHQLRTAVPANQLRSSRHGRPGLSHHGQHKQLTRLVAGTTVSWKPRTAQRGTSGGVPRFPGAGWRLSAARPRSRVMIASSAARSAAGVQMFVDGVELLWALPWLPRPRQPHHPVPPAFAVAGMVTANLDHRLELVLRKVFAEVNGIQSGDGRHLRQPSAQARRARGRDLFSQPGLPGPPRQAASRRRDKQRGRAWRPSGLPSAIVPTAGWLSGDGPWRHAEVTGRSWPARGPRRPGSSTSDHALGG